jgi:GAF domain-containing protein
LRLGIHSSLSLPLQVRERTIGALNLYGEPPKAFDEHAEQLASRFARQAAATLANAEIHDRTVSLVSQLNEAMTSRSVIDMARGILMATTGCNADEAFELLRAQSQHENIKVRDIAAQIVRNTVNSRDDDAR